MEKLTSIRIGKRFCGPPGYGNGGYVCGLIAKHFATRLSTSADVPQVRLHAPVPLATSLDLWVLPDESLQLKHEERLIATCYPEQLLVEAPIPIGYPAAVEVSKYCRGLQFHPFPECFVCGPDRLPGDGLRILPGRLAGTEYLPGTTMPGKNLVAAPWRPDSSLKSASLTDYGHHVVSAEFVWAALDCTGSFSIDFNAEKILVLGQLKAQLVAPVKIGESCVVMGWLKHVEGRKHTAETAIFNSAKQICGLSEAIWIQL
jgi:hypothetical protein